MTDGRADGSRVRTVFLGSGGFGLDALRTLRDHPDIELTGVVTAPPRPAGRSRHPVPTVVATTAAELGIPVLTPGRLRAPDSVEAILSLRPDLVVLADYGQIVPVTLLDRRYGALNLHPSLLPRHRGASPIPAAILAGDTETGVTLMRMDAGLDTGPLVAQRRHPLDGTETAPDLEAALGLEAAGLLDGSVGPWVRGDLVARPQSTIGMTLTRPLRREDGRLDPTCPTDVLERQVRAYQPWPGSFVDTVAGRLVVWASRIGPVADGSPGLFVADGLVTGDGRLLLDDVQPAGGRRMSWDEFLRGRPSIVGSHIVPGP